MYKYHMYISLLQIIKKEEEYIVNFKNCIDDTGFSLRILR